MKLKSLALISLLALVLPATFLAQEEKPQSETQQNPMVQKIFQIKHADVNSLNRMFSVFQVITRPDENLRTISVSGSRESVAAVEEAIERFDVPPPPDKNIELVFHMLLASKNASTETALPDNLEDVAKQLKTLFGFGSLQLIETAIMRLRDGAQGEASGAVMYPGLLEKDRPATYQLRVGKVSISSAVEEEMIRLDGLRWGFRVPYLDKVVGAFKGSGSEPTWRFLDAGFNTEIDVREGQKVVVGKTWPGCQQQQPHPGGDRQSG